VAVEGPKAIGKVRTHHRPESREIEYPLDSMESEKERCDWKEGDEPSRSLASDLDSPSNGGHTGEEETDLLYIQTEICDFNLEEYLELRSLLVRRAVRQCEDGRLYRKHDMEVFPNLFYEGFAITLQMLAALRYIHHTHKLIHRDLKPSNIFMIKKSNRT
jgi:hypothetical protein